VTVLTQRGKTTRVDSSVVYSDYSKLYVIPEKRDMIVYIISEAEQTYLVILIA
jgi:hypothetical protein